MLSRCANLLASRHGVFPAVLLIAFGCVFGDVSAFGATQTPFPCPTYLQPRVGFWVKIFSRYSSRDFVVHDRNKVWRIYGVMHLPGIGEPSPEEISQTDNYLENRYEKILESLADGVQPADPAAVRVTAMFHGASSAELRAAAANIGVQRGLRDYFAQGIARSERYRGMMERIFGDYGLPPGLIYLAAVESNFDPRARSVADAVGIWQFVASTGREYMHISRYRDDRLNPTRATIAAAKLLRSNYDALGSWPLAITAYDYGAQGMARAASEYAGNYQQILEHWDGPAFGFAVKNYYAEFLAALRIYENQDQYFPGLPQPENPTLLVADNDATQMSAERDEGRSVIQHTAVQRYTLRRGETLDDVAHHYGVTLASLMEVNRIENPRRLRAGRVLMIPGTLMASTNVTVKRCRLHRGETLYDVAHRYGVTLASLMQVNRIENARRLRAGRVLLIPQAGMAYAREELRRYRVRAGDTLYAIAQRAGIAVSKLMAINQVDHPRSLNVGAILLIPST
jgi:membrane-bound lytic murein transglycosylase D